MSLIFYSLCESRVKRELSSFTLDVVVNILKPLVKVNKKTQEGNLGIGMR